MSPVNHRKLMAFGKKKTNPQTSVWTKNTSRLQRRIAYKQHCYSKATKSNSHHRPLYHLVPNMTVPWSLTCILMPFLINSISTDTRRWFTALHRHKKVTQAPEAVEMDPQSHLPRPCTRQLGFFPSPARDQRPACICALTNRHCSFPHASRIAPHNTFPTKPMGRARRWSSQLQDAQGILPVASSRSQGGGKRVCRVRNSWSPSARDWKHHVKVSKRHKLLGTEAISAVVLRGAMAPLHLSRSLTDRELKQHASCPSVRAGPAWPSSGSQHFTKAGVPGRWHCRGKALVLPPTRKAGGCPSMPFIQQDD